MSNRTLISLQYTSTKEGLALLATLHTIHETRHPKYKPTNYQHTLLQAQPTRHNTIMSQVMTPLAWPTQARTVTRQQKHTSLLTTPVPTCASTEWKYEYYKITWMFRELIASEPLSGPQKWKQDLLAEALRVLHSIQDSSESPAAASRQDHSKWCDVMVRRIIAESLWETGGTVSFYDCCEQMRTGRSKAAAARLASQARQSWTTITGTDLSTEFSLAA